MNKIVKNTLISAIALTFIITIVSSVFSYIAMSQDFDHLFGYFAAGSVNAAIAMYLPMAVPVIAIVACIIIRKKAYFHGSPSTGGIPTVFASVLTGLLMLPDAYFTIPEVGELSKLQIGIIISAVISAVYFLLLPFFGKKSFMLFLSFAPALWAAFKLLDEYFRVGAPINSPIRTINLTMFALLLVFFAEEIRFGIGKQSVGGYYFFILSAIVFTGCATFPKLIMIFTDNSDFGFSFIEWGLGAAIFLFLLARLAALPEIIKEEPITEDKSIVEATLAEEAVDVANDGTAEESAEENSASDEQDQ